MILLADTVANAIEHDFIRINPIYIATMLISVIGIGFGWYIVRLDHMVEHLRDEVIDLKQEIGKLQNADIVCTKDQEIMKLDITTVWREMVRMAVGKRRLPDPVEDDELEQRRKLVDPK